MYCSKCGIHLDDNAAFCSKCGTKVSTNIESCNVKQQEATSIPANSIPFTTGILDDSVFTVLGILSNPIWMTYELLKDGCSSAPRFDHLYNSFSLDMRDNMSKINKFFTTHEYVWWRGLTDMFYMYPNIPEKKLANISNVFVDMDNDETPLLFFDSREQFIVTNKYIYARNKEKETFSWNLRSNITIRLKKALAICTFLVFDNCFEIQVVLNKKNEMGFEFLVDTVIKTTYLLQHFQGMNIRFIDALNELRKMPLSIEEKRMDDPYKFRKWANWIDFCYDDNVNID